MSNVYELIILFIIFHHQDADLVHAAALGGAGVIVARASRQAARDVLQQRDQKIGEN